MLLKLFGVGVFVVDIAMCIFSLFTRTRTDKDSEKLCLAERQMAAFLCDAGEVVSSFFRLSLFMISTLSQVRHLAQLRVSRFVFEVSWSQPLKLVV